MPIILTEEGKNLLERLVAETLFNHPECLPQFRKLEQFLANYEIPNLRDGKQ